MLMLLSIHGRIVAFPYLTQLCMSVVLVASLLRFLALARMLVANLRLLWCRFAMFWWLLALRRIDVCGVWMVQFYCTVSFLVDRWIT
jgi:hypothetical protein